MRRARVVTQGYKSLLKTNLKETSYERQGVAITCNSTFFFFFQQFIHANGKQTSKLDILGPLWTEHSSDRRIPLTKDQ